MKIGEGKFYRTRNGGCIGPMAPCREEGYAWQGIDHRDNSLEVYTEDGVFDESRADPSSMDLVAEWVDDEPGEQPAPQSTTKRSVLEAAIQTVADRGVPYGGVEDNFARIARLWNAHLINRYADGFGGDTTIAVPRLDGADVSLMMILMKVARLEANPTHDDSIVDIAGYAACLGEIAAKKTA